MSYKKCVKEVGKTLEERGLEGHDTIAAGMCSMWADENGVERTFGRSISNEEVRRSFGMDIEGQESLSFMESEGIETVEFPVIAITSGPHEYKVDDIQQKVYIEPSILKENIEKFTELPIYFNHQRTPEDLIGMATEPKVEEMDNGKFGIKMKAKVSNETERGKEVLKKVKDGSVTHVSIDWLSNDVDVMGDTYAFNIRPTEVSFIDNATADPVCKECTIETKCDIHEPEAKDSHDDCGCGGKEGSCECKKQDGMTTEVENMTEEVKEKSATENIVEREFASLRVKLEEANASKEELKNQYEEALKQIEAFKLTEEKRAAKEAEALKAATVEAIISKEMVLGTLIEDSKDTRVEELSAWDENRLTGFSEALAAMPEAVEVERTFGKGKSPEGEAITETEREFAVTKDETGRIHLDVGMLKKQRGD